ncbi:IS3-like element IS1520 family transposase [Levilactobacillus brevis]|uniref:IS3-like element IS1520 family transposase n=1 Tax=Levilactobacillus brevis TaxID=1580 RepID=UPI0029355712|nr:IS3-like element IS1520 family transposase [Levilactobacillus brevis]MDV2566161.1 IS3-like element IS1520 family transposase [Levilactobacillus brevis]MDV2585708.1 IS3-like element IS1520 family transposase [Levilactobacillus brevis]
MAIKYSNEFKESIVSLSQTGRSANSLAKEYNVSVSTVTKWIKQADPNNTKVLSSNERALIKENKRLKEELDIFKTSGGAHGKKLIIKGRALVLEVVNANLLAGHRITRILSVLKIPRSTYYDYLHWQPSRTERRRHLIKQEVLTAWLRYPMYGYPRLTILLNQQSDIHVSQRLVYQQMCELGIRSRMVKRINKPTTQTDYDQRPNLIKQLTDQSGILLTDITCIPLNHTWCYLASVFNPVTRRVIAYQLNTQMTKELATNVITQVMAQAVKPQIIHSDMGSQYTSDLFKNTLSKYGIKHSYSRKGQPGDNARIESFHSILKREYVNFQDFKTIHEAIAGIDNYIRWYNSDRISLVA